jgi:ribosomal protein S18 acetylase RimI-like enzyme
VSVRRAVRGDAAAIAALWRSLFETHAAIDPAFALREGAETKLVIAVLRALDDRGAAVWVAEREGACVAFCTARVEHATTLASEACRVAIDEIAVSAAWRRGGLGRELVEAALAWAKQCGAQRVEVRVAARNTAGQAFWRALGFGDFVDVLDRRL